MSVQIPSDLLPHDGRFGSGPSKVRAAQIARLSDPTAPIGQSHRSAPVKSIVGSIRSGISELFNLPAGYEVVLGNGGASLLWDAIAFSVVESRAQAATFGEFSAKAARASAKVPWVEAVELVQADPGSIALCQTTDGIDTYLYPQNETSTGVLSPVSRFGGPDALTVVDGTSSAGGVLVEIASTDIYYFSPQKCFGSDGGLWIAVMSPRAIERIERLTSERWVPDVLNLKLAIDNSRKDQTLNTPAVSNLLMIAQQLSWMIESGGLAAMNARTASSSSLVYKWAEARPDATPFVSDPTYRSQVVTTIDFDDGVATPAISAFLRNAGVVDIDPYRSLHRNQFRISTFPNVELSDVQALLACIDWAIEAGIGRS